MYTERLIGNRMGVPFVEATQTDAGGATENAVFTLPNHTFRGLGPVGLMIVSVASGITSTILGVTISVNNLTLLLTNSNGTAVTSLPTGDYTFIFNKINNTLKIL